jgi:hypothetical protein
MKKNYFHSFLLFLTAAFFHTASAQVATLYTFTQTFVPYLAVSGGTAFGSSTSDDVVYVDPAIPLGSNHGASGPGVDIGFSFMFNNVRYDRVGICNDGWITFGKSILGTNAVNTNASNYFAVISASSSASADLQNRIAVFCRDIEGQTGSEIRAVTLGSSPNQTFVVQWSNYRKYGATGDAFDFQIRLSETTNIVELVYGSFINGAVAGTAQIGLRGIVNTDFSNRVTSAAISWSASIAGGINTAGALFNNTGVSPLYGQSYKWTPPQCSGTLAALSASTNASFICPGGSSTITLLNSYTVSGITYTWSASGTSTGNYTLIANTNSPYLAAGPIPSNSWFQAVSTCLNGGSTVTSNPLNVQVAAPTINSIPYLEGFEGLIINDQLPNCSWVASNMPAVCKTYTASGTNNRIPFNGTKFAAFSSGTNVNGDYFYTSGLQLNAGVTYSAAVAYITDGNAGWTNFSILYGTSQSSTGLIPIASIGPINNSNYFQLSNTFTVANSGVYFIAIKCIGTSTPQYLSFDDVRVTAPCSLNGPTLNINANFPLVCSGTPVIITAGGANTYSWNTGATSSVITVTPTLTTVYSVTGTYTASGCSATVSQTITVKNAPLVSVSANTLLVCSGSTVSLVATGANTYTWSNTGLGDSVIVNPLLSTIYTVYGENTNGCGAFASISISVNPLPVISVISTASSVLCLGETATLSAFGAVNYQWSSPGVFLQSNPVLVKPTVTSTYTITGTDANFCVNTSTFTQIVGLCTGVNDPISRSNKSILFPNPANEHVTLVLGRSYFKTWELINALGQTILSGKINGDSAIINISKIPEGCYNIKAISDQGFELMKFVKN